jgi:hypothetical protein
MNDLSFNFIDYLMEYTQDAESPDEFWRWAAISALSATMRSNVFVKCSIGTIYPNMFVILFSDSGIARKAAPCKFAGRLVQEAQCTKFINGRATMQAVIKELSLASSNEQGVLINGASGMLYTEELSSFAVQDPATIPILTDLYDYHENWSTNLIGGSYKLKQVCVSLLAASNSDLFRAVYTEQAIKGGLLGRTFIIKQDQARHRKSLLDLQESQLDYKPLVDHLKRVKQLKGPVGFTDVAKKHYNDWYYGMPADYFHDKIGFGARLGTHVLKIALALAVARADFDMKIDLLEIQEAIVLCGEIKKNYKGVTMASGPGSLSAQTALILKIIVTQPDYKIERPKLMQMMLGELKIDEFNAVMEMLTNANMIAELPRGGRIFYGVTQNGLDTMLGEGAGA